MRTQNLIVSGILDKAAFWRWYAFDALEPADRDHLLFWFDREQTVAMPQPTGWYLVLRIDVPRDRAWLVLRRDRPDGVLDPLETAARHHLGRRQRGAPDRDPPCLTWAEHGAIVERSMFTVFVGIDPWKAALLLAPWVGHETGDPGELAARRRVIAEVLTGRGLFDEPEAGRLAALLMPARVPAGPREFVQGSAAGSAMVQFRRQLELD